MERAMSKGFMVSLGETGLGYESGTLAMRMARATGR